jgi:hypothetical protein
MRSTVTFHRNGVQPLLLLLDASEHTPFLVALVKRSPISRGRVLDCEKRCKPYLNPSR